MGAVAASLGGPRRGLPPAAGGPLAVALAACALGAAAAWIVFVGAGAHVFHYDARAHLVVARRVVDSLTPGWLQLGAVWLPRPHLLNVVPAQSDMLYYRGLFASLAGAAAFLFALWALGRTVTTLSGDVRAGALAMAALVLNPGWLYLQATPLTEPLYLATVTGLVLYVVRWRETGRPRDLGGAILFSAAACLTRYEAWPVALAAAAIAAAPAPRGRPRERVRAALLFAVAGLLLPIAAFFLHSWIATERPFYVMDSQFLVRPKGDLGRSLELVLSGVAGAFGLTACALAVAAAVHLALARRWLGLAVAAAFAAPAVVTITAYLAGHPAKARYPLLLAPALATAVCCATSRRRPAQLAAAAVFALQPIAVGPPLPVLAEATRSYRAEIAEGPGLAALRHTYGGGRILASMGSAAPLLFDLGLPLREIVHEGNGTYWEYAVVDPQRYVSWVLVSPGDTLDQVRAYRPRFPEGFVPVRSIGRFTVYAPAPVPRAAAVPRREDARKAALQRPRGR